MEEDKGAPAPHTFEVPCLVTAAQAFERLLLKMGFSVVNFNRILDFALSSNLEGS